MKRDIKLTDAEIINGLIKGDEKVINFLYQHSFNNIFLFILKNSGSIEDAKDVFQDALLVVYQNVVHNKIVLHDSFQKYLFVICKNIWAKKLTRQKIHNRILDELTDLGFDDETIENSIVTVEKKNLFLDHIDLLDDRCKKMIKLYNKGMSLAKVAEQLKFDSINYARKLKYQCKEKLLRSIKNDPRFNELSNTNSYEKKY